MQNTVPLLKTIVTDLDAEIRFYAAVFGKAPTMTTERSAIWVTDDPPLRFKIAQSGRQTHASSGAGPV